MLSNRRSVVLFLLLCLGPALASCGKSDHTYKDEKRAELMNRSVFVVTASFKETRRLKEKGHIDVVESRPGFSDKMEYLVNFRIRDFLKGNYGKKEVSVGVNLPSMAFGIKPSEYPGEKIYTLYVGYNEKLKRNALIGAEWEKIKYS